MATCKDCTEIQEKQDGTAPQRAIYHQATMYDHLPPFKDFKKSQERGLLYAEEKEERRKQHENFTSFILPPNSDFDDFSFQDETTSTSCTNELIESVSCLNISRSPIQCPVFVCSKTIGVTSLLSHFVRDHIIRVGVNFDVVVKDQRAVLLFNDSKLKYEENICCGVLAYGGCSLSEKARPVTIGISLRNAFLPDTFQQYANCLPILIMACKTSLSAFISTKEDNMKQKEDQSDEIVVLWLATIETIKPIYGTLTVVNANFSKSRSAIVKIRNLKDSQYPRHFISVESDYLMLTHEELNMLTNKENGSIQLEIFINEFD